MSVRRAPRGRRWIRGVTTDSTHPPRDLFTRDARTIARVLAAPRVSPKGTGSGLRMLQYFINRAGKGMSRTRRRELEKARQLLRARLEREKGAAARTRGRGRRTRTRR